MIILSRLILNCDLARAHLLHKTCWVNIILHVVVDWTVRLNTYIYISCRFEKCVSANLYPETSVRLIGFSR